MLCLFTHKVLGEELLMALRINGETVSEGEIVTIDGDKISLPVELLRRLRLHPPAGTPPNAATIPLDSVNGLHARIDRQAMVLDIAADPESFEPSVLRNYIPTRPADTPDHPGAFINYDLLGQEVGNNKLSSGLFSMGAFSDYGVVMSDAVINNTQGTVRLRNYLTQDNGNDHDSFVAGDSFLPADSIGEQFPFGGFQVSSHMAMNDPRRIPSETILGQAAVPSNIDVYVNNALQSRQSVPTGPFVLENIPVATGDGNIRVVVHDALGQEQVIVRSFYASPYLLPEGSGDYTYQAGFLRRSYGATSFDYAEPFTSGTQRYGWTHWLTTELHGEASAQRQVVGGQNSFLVAPFGTVRAGGAVSDRAGVPGFLGLFGAETSTRPFSIGFSGEMASSHFTQLGYTLYRTTEQSAQVQLNYDLGDYGALAASLIHFKITDQPVSNIAAASYNVNVPRIGFFGISAFDTIGSGAKGAILSFSMTFGERGTLSTQATHDQNGWGESVQAREDAPLSGGMGYRMLADNSQPTRRAEGGLSYLSPYGQIDADGGVLNSQPVGRLNMTGSVGLFDGVPFAAQHSDGNFAMVDTGGIGGVHVFDDRQPVGVTDTDGKLMIPHLRPNEVNEISIDPADIPFNITVPQVEKEVVPRNQTGYVVNFGMQRVLSATAALVREDGSFVPPGTETRNIKSGESTIVGNDGLIYLTDLTGDDIFRADLAGSACEARVIMPNTDALQPDLGKIICH